MNFFKGTVDNIFSAFVLVEASRLGYYRLITNRPTPTERMMMPIEAGATIVFDETVTGMKRWIDGKIWTQSRFVNGFFIYDEIEESKRGLKKGSSPPTTNRKVLSKRAISVIAPDGRHFHVINYYYNDGPEIPTTPLWPNYPNYHQLLNDAKRYRYIKSYRATSKICRKLFPAPKHELPFYLQRDYPNESNNEAITNENSSNSIPASNSPTENQMKIDFLLDRPRSFANPELTLPPIEPFLKPSQTPNNINRSDTDMKCLSRFNSLPF